MPWVDWGIRRRSLWACVILSVPAARRHHAGGRLARARAATDIDPQPRAGPAPWPRARVLPAVR
jgi:hypothetical protein